MKLKGTIKFLELTNEQFLMTVGQLESVDSIFGQKTDGEIKIKLEELDSTDSPRAVNINFVIDKTPLATKGYNVGKKLIVDIDKVTEINNTDYFAYLTGEELLAADTKYIFNFVDTENYIKYEWVVDIPTNMKSDFEYLGYYRLKLEIAEDI